MIDPREPDYSNTPACDRRASFGYAPAAPEAVPQATIITPFFNTGAVFHETARCVLRQSFQQFEWLIVNDGSDNPDALALIDEYRGRDARIRVIDLPRNEGVCAARNAGFEHASTPVCLQLDSDDLIEPTKLEKSLWFLESHPEFGFVNGWTVGFGDHEYLWTRGFHERDAFLAENLATITVAIRRELHGEVGGYDRELRGGLEDWDFWLKCAAHGAWGATIPEYLDWYRRRPEEDRDWENMKAPAWREDFQQRARGRYPHIFNGSFPNVQAKPPEPYEFTDASPPLSNPLAGKKPRLLMIVPWLRMGGADKFNRDLVEQLTKRGWEITLAATLGDEHAWMPDFCRFTPDVFALPSFLKPVDYPRFLRYLIESRGVDVVMVTNSEVGYLLLPYLRSVCPKPAYVDYCHMEEEYWRSGGYPRFGVGYQDLLDLNIVASEHLKRWMIGRGAQPERIEVATINVDADYWTPNELARREVRRLHAIAGETPVILYAGRLCEQKQPRVFASVMLELARRNVECVTLVAGDGPDRAWLEEFIEGRKLKRRVRLLGAVPSEQMHDLLSAADIFFLPSLWEGIALSIYEAMAMRLAVVGAVVGGQRELVTEECGVLLPRGAHDEETARYADALTDLLEHAQRRRDLGERARRRVCEHFRLDTMGERMNALLGTAQRDHIAAPRPVISRGVAVELANLALEHLRVNTALDDLWRIRDDYQSVAAERDRLRSRLVPRARRLLGRALRSTGLLRR